LICKFLLSPRRFCSKNVALDLRLRRRQPSRRHWRRPQTTDHQATVTFGRGGAGAHPPPWCMKPQAGRPPLRVHAQLRSQPISEDLVANGSALDGTSREAPRSFPSGVPPKVQNQATTGSRSCAPFGAGLLWWKSSQRQSRPWPACARKSWSTLLRPPPASQVASRVGFGRRLLESWILSEPRLCATALHRSLKRSGGSRKGWTAAPGCPSAGSRIALPSTRAKSLAGDGPLKIRIPSMD
jgi:hypothetical protein